MLLSNVLNALGATPEGLATVAESAVSVVCCEACSMLCGVKVPFSIVENRMAQFNGTLWAHKMPNSETLWWGVGAQCGRIQIYVRLDVPQCRGEAMLLELGHTVGMTCNCVE